VDAVGVNNILVVNGACGDGTPYLYQSESANVLNAVWGNAWLDSSTDKSASIAIATTRWAETLASGGDVWVAEAAPSDFTAAVLARLGSLYPSVNRKRVRVVQHRLGSPSNEDRTSSAGIELVKREADYITIPNADSTSGRTAGFNANSTRFSDIASHGRYASEWSVAFQYLDPGEKLDISDTIGLLYIIDDTQTVTIDQFGYRYLR